MTIASEVTRIKTNIAQAYTALEEKGATIPEMKNSDNLAEAIGSVSAGGGNSGIIYRDDVSLPAIFDEIDAFVEKGFGEINQHTWIVGLILPKYAKNIVIRPKFATKYYYNGEIVDLKYSLGCNYPLTIVEDNRVIYFNISASTNDITNGLNNLIRVNLAEADDNGDSSSKAIRYTYISIKYCGSAQGKLGNFNPYAFGSYSGDYEAIKLNNCIISNALTSDVLYEGRFASHVLPVSNFSSVDTSNSSKWVSNFSNVMVLPNLPYGLDLSFITTDTKLILGHASWGYASSTRLRSAYISLPNAPVVVGAKQFFSKENWEYIAEHAPNVTNRTLTMGEVNIAICGGEDSEIITTLKNKGWTVA